MKHQQLCRLTHKLHPLPAGLVGSQLHDSFMHGPGEVQKSGSAAQEQGSGLRVASGLQGCQGVAVLPVNHHTCDRGECAKATNPDY